MLKYEKTYYSWLFQGGAYWSFWKTEEFAFKVWRVKNWGKSQRWMQKIWRLIVRGCEDHKNWWVSVMTVFVILMIMKLTHLSCLFDSRHKSLCMEWSIALSRVWVITGEGGWWTPILQVFRGLAMTVFSGKCFILFMWWWLLTYLLLERQLDYWQYYLHHSRKTKA